MTTEKEKQLRVNHRIHAREVRLIGKEGEQIGVVGIQEALGLAQEAGLDLVELSPMAKPPVCKIMDYGKHLFQIKKKKTEAKKKQHKVSIKEIKYSPRIEEGDYQTKFNRIVKFIDAGDKVKVTVRFRGREMAHRDIGMELLRRIAKDSVNVAAIEQEPRFEGRQGAMILIPKKKV